MRLAVTVGSGYSSKSGFVVGDVVEGDAEVESLEERITVDVTVDELREVLEGESLLTGEGSGVFGRVEDQGVKGVVDVGKRRGLG